MDLKLKFSVTVPGKIILMGEHSVLYKKAGLAASINKRTFLSFIESEPEDPITVEFQNLNLTKSWDFSKVLSLVASEKVLLCDPKFFSIENPRLLHHEELITTIYKDSALKLEDLSLPQKSSLLGFLYVLSSMLWTVDVDLQPFTVKLHSELVMGAGTGSSAAFSVSIAAALFNFVKEKAKKKFGLGVHNISKPTFKPYRMSLSEESGSFTQEDKDVINEWAYSIERIMHGTPSGLDNTVCTFGKAVQINAKITSVEGPNFERLTEIPSLRVLLVNTNIPRNTVTMTKKVSALYEVCPTAMSAVLNAMDTVARDFIERLHKMKSSTEDPADIYGQLQGLIDIQHGLLNTIGASHFRLEEICTITKRRGFHSKLTGAGGGGCAFTLIPPYATEECIGECIADLKSSGFLVEDINIISEGLTLDTV